jgi:hypothetical protein
VIYNAAIYPNCKGKILKLLEFEGEKKKSKQEKGKLFGVNGKPIRRRKNLKSNSCKIRVVKVTLVCFNLAIVYKFFFFWIWKEGCNK